MTRPNTPLTAIASDVSATMPTDQNPPATAPHDAALPPGTNPHLDYNLHPLKVAGLDHYTEQPEGDERFRIS